MTAVVATWEASPSLVYGAALLMRLGVTPPPGFKSRSLRRGSAQPSTTPTPVGNN